MIYKKYISNYMSNYNFKCIFIFVCILLLFIISNYLFRTNNTEDFNSISEYPTKYIEDDCNIYLKSDLKGKNQDFCKNSAFVKDGNLLKNLCQENGTFQILDLEIDQNKKQFFGCSPNQNNVLGLKWENPNIGNIPNKLYSVPSTFYNLYFNNNPYKGTWEYKDTIGQINLDGSNFMLIKQGNNVGTWSSMNMPSNSNNYSISFWFYTNSNNAGWRSIFHVTNNNTDCCNLKNRQPAAWLYPNSSEIMISTGIPSNGNWYTTVGGTLMNNLNHCIISFDKYGYKVYINGSEKYRNVRTPNNEQILFTDPNSIVYIADPWYSKGKNNSLYIKNMIFWDVSFNEIYANKLYNSYLPIIREKNKIKIMGKKQNTDEESFRTPFKLNKRLTLGQYKDLNLTSTKSITISFTINVKKNYPQGVNIMLITLNNFDWNWRVPGIWLYPNQCALNICISTDYYWNENIEYLPFEMNKDVYFQIVFDADSRQIIVYKDKNWKSPTIHQCTGNFYYITDDLRLWLAANGLGENVEVSNFEIETGVFTPKII